MGTFSSFTEGLIAKTTAAAWRAALGISDFTPPLSIDQGGTGANSVSGARAVFGVSPSSLSFSTTKGSNQTIVGATTETKITFTNSPAWNDGGYFDAVNSRWTPPANKVLITATAVFQSTNIVDGDAIYIVLYKNGSAYRRFQLMYVGAGGGPVLSGCQLDNASGADYYEVYVYCTHANCVVDATSYFQGMTL